MVVASSAKSQNVSTLQGASAFASVTEEDVKSVALMAVKSSLKAEVYAVLTVVVQDVLEKTAKILLKGRKVYAAVTEAVLGLNLKVIPSLGQAQLKLKHTAIKAKAKAKAKDPVQNAKGVQRE
mmetsp:Transcript_13854/g.17179  ORF Transcript_13854/g.17179 Transcript_13854/m.17179 type:complete len:123 (-) Transcript_13854:433-801(-)|eukprot:CAMPEP_0204856036 /NCGR_PEP_ID=MMETSP1347-20130617/17740_1 /ASSEMBLY_ACC=CAM_ASM_000690 /TAXON_ID=215587 /ORGANISM="Aplanochytrium stocchinoi, Strain GSBS06" /LENGTH=122 /DNA_ID=CAMNT_0052002527 /DNA_START=481 /DNA_END=849 /DNA_ORIENTATION=-